MDKEKTFNKLSYNESSFIINTINEKISNYIKYCKEQRFYTDDDFKKDLYYKMQLDILEKYKNIEKYIALPKNYL